MSGHGQPETSQQRWPTSDHATDPQASPRKVILPRLEGPLYVAPATVKRTAHACERCRTLRAKCTGGRRCEKCIIDKAECRYGDGKRERNKKEMASQLQKSTLLAKQNEQLLAALREVSGNPDFDFTKHPAATQLLSKYPPEEDSDGGDRMGSPLSDGRDTDWAPVDQRKAVSFSGGGPSRAMDSLAPSVPSGGGSGASGYIGKSSEISWLQWAQEHMSSKPGEADHMLVATDEDGGHGLSLDYHMDDADLLAVDEESVDPMELPPLSVAIALADAYFETVHGTFPLVDRAPFMEVLIKRCRSQPPSSWEGRRWLSMANIIFAVGASWTYLTRPRRAGMEGPHIGQGDHIIYYARARALGLDHRLIIDHPLLEQIQALGVLGLYLLVNHQVSWAWTTVGQAIRHAVALGLHVRIAATTDPTQQKIRSRTWWSLYGLEQLLGNFTGRHTSTPDDDMATSSALVSETDLVAQHVQTRVPPEAAQQQSLSPQSPVGSEGSQRLPQVYYFISRIRLSIIGHKIRSTVYSSGQTDEGWSRMQQSIMHFDRELTQWSAGIPEEMKLPQGVEVFEVFSADRYGGRFLDCVELAMSYQSTRMILFRPCLRPLEKTTRAEWTLSRSIDQDAATACVSAAQSLLALLPRDAPSSSALKRLPWWSLLHYLTQAGAVLILELSLQAEHMPSQINQLLRDLEKAMAWLEELAACSLSAWRSWRILRELALLAADGLNVVVTLPEDIQKPPGWKPGHKQQHGRSLALQGRQPSLLPVDAGMAGSSWSYPYDAPH